uniref:Uncharacterized protein n=1 Tax=Anopheles epiroticus TaxID=199890 RepID=A0A182PHV6_9DIPT
MTTTTTTTTTTTETGTLAEHFMLSVQSPGCAGMERLGVPARGSIGSPPLRSERAGFHHQQQSQQQQQQSQQNSQQQQKGLQQQSAQQQQQPSQQNHHRQHHHHNLQHHHAHQYHQQTAATAGYGNLILSSTTSSNFRSNHNQSYPFIPHQAHGHGGGSSSSGSSSINYKTNYSNSSYGGSSIGSTISSSNPVTTSFPQCTYHVALPDGEYGPDRDLRIRTPSQQAEIPRTYVKAPPNKTVRDVPLQYQSTGGITTLGTTMTGSTGGSSSLANSMVDVASYYGSVKTIGRQSVDGGRLAATTSGPSLGGVSTNASFPAASITTCQQKSVDKLQKILRFLPGKATKSSTSSSSSSSPSSSSTINNNLQGHYRSPPAAVSSSLASPTSSAGSSSTSSPTAATVARPSESSGPVGSGSGSDPGHAPFTM